METIPKIMKTGTIQEPIDVKALLGIFMEDALNLAIIFSFHSDSTEISSEMCIQAMKIRTYYGSEFWKDVEINQRASKAKELIDIIQNDMQNNEELMDENEIDSITNEINESKEKNQNGKCICENCQKFHTINEKWNSWNPISPIDIILKKSIETNQ